MKPTITSLRFKFDRDEITAYEYIHGIVEVYRNPDWECDATENLVADCIEEIMFLYNDDAEHPNLPVCEEDVEQFAILLMTILFNYADNSKKVLAELRDLYSQELDRIF